MATATNGNSCVDLMKGTLVLPIARYPSSVATDAALKIAANQVQTTLTMRVSTLDTIFRVSDTSRLVVDMLLSIDNEIVSVSAIDTASHIITVVRGFDGTIPSSHNAGRLLQAYIVAWHHNALAAEIKAIETALGPNLSNVGTGSAGYGVLSTLYDFSARTPGGSLIVGANSITIAPVPQGVNGTDLEHYLYVSGGTGTAEACKIVGGSAVAGAPSGTLIIQCANTHSGPWSIRSATAGVQEAIVANASASGYFDVKLPNGMVEFYATAHSVANTPGITVSGQGHRSTKINMHANVPVFQFVDVYYPAVRNLDIHYWVTGTTYAIRFDACPAATVKSVAIMAPSGVRFYNLSGAKAINTVVNVTDTGGTGIYYDQATGGEAGYFTDLFINSLTGAGRAYIGFDLQSAAGVLITESHFIDFGVNLNINNASGSLIANNYFDQGLISVQIAPAAGKIAERNTFSNNWINGAETMGLRVDGSAGVIQNLTFTGCQFQLNGTDGVYINVAKDLNFTANIVTNNSNIASNPASVAGQWRGVLLSGVVGAVLTGNQFGSSNFYAAPVSVSQIVVVGTTATATLPGTGPPAGYAIKISGSNTPSLNGNFRVTAGGPFFVSWTTSTAPGTYTAGSMTANGTDATHDNDLLIGGGDEYVITGNRFGGWIGAPLNDASTGASKVIENNVGLSGLVGDLNTDTAAGTLNLAGYDLEVYNLSGTTAVTAMTGGWKGRNVTLIRTAAGSVTVMGLPLAQNGRIDCSYNSGQWWCK